MTDETKELTKEIQNLKDEVIVWKRSAEQLQIRAQTAEGKLTELQEVMKDRALEAKFADTNQ